MTIPTETTELPSTLVKRWRDEAAAMEKRAGELSYGHPVIANDYEKKAEQKRRCADDLESALTKAEAVEPVAEPDGWRERERLALLWLRELLDGCEVEEGTEPLLPPSTYLETIVLTCRFQPGCSGKAETAKRIREILAAPIRKPAAEPAASVPDGWQLVPIVATRAMVSSGWESGKLVGDTRVIVSVSGVWDAMLSTAAAHNNPASDYALCCDTPAYCSSVRRCTATDAAPDGWGLIPQPIVESDAPPHYIPSEKRAYASGFNWCVAAAQTTMTVTPPTNQEGAAP